MTPLCTIKLQELTERVVRLCKNINDKNAVAMGKDWTWAELTHEALPELKKYLKEINE